MFSSVESIERQRFVIKISGSQVNTYHYCFSSYSWFSDCPLLALSL